MPDRRWHRCVLHITCATLGIQLPSPLHRVQMRVLARFPYQDPALRIPPPPYCHCGACFNKAENFQVSPRSRPDPLDWSVRRFSTPRGSGLVWSGGIRNISRVGSGDVQMSRVVGSGQNRPVSSDSIGEKKPYYTVFFSKNIRPTRLARQLKNCSLSLKSIFAVLDV